MAKVLKNIFDPAVDEVVQNFTIQSWHVSQSVDAFTGADAYDITLSGSLDVTGPTEILGNVDITGDTQVLGPVTISGSLAINGLTDIIPLQD
jgi:hypothetical protein